MSELHAPMQVGETQFETEDGFLLCKNVPLARTAPQGREMHYTVGELAEANLKGDEYGLISVTRDESEVFAPKAITSLNGMDVTMGHPPRGSNPKTYKSVSVGVVLNPRRGEGIHSDKIVGDLLIKDASAIAAIKSKTVREVSAGYVAKYRQLGAGRASQHDIRHNHLALVPPDSRGRCGSECAIGDHEMTIESPDKSSVFDMFKAFVAGQESGRTPAITGDKSDPMATLTAAVAKLTGDVATIAGAVAKLTKDEDKAAEEDEAKKKAAAEKAEQDKANVGDTAAFGVRMGDIAAKSAMIAPGVKMLTADSAITTAVQMADHACACQRVALAAALGAAKTKDVISNMITALGGDPANLSKASAATIDAIFNASAEVVRARNNAATGAAITGASVAVADMPVRNTSELIKREQARRDSINAKRYGSNNQSAG